MDRTVVQWSLPSPIFTERFDIPASQIEEFTKGEISPKVRRWKEREEGEGRRGEGRRKKEREGE
jgi:hypothetical protein